MGSRHGRVMVRRPFAPPRAWTLRSGAPPRGSVAGRRLSRDVARSGIPSWDPKPGRMVGTGGAAQMTVPRPAGGSRGCMGRHPVGKAAS